LVGCAGALIDDELYVFGRWDDTLTVNGQQFTAGVLESAVRGVAGANHAAVVRINGPDGAICAVVEVDPQAQLEAAAVQEAIARATGVMVSTVVPRLSGEPGAMARAAHPAAAAERTCQAPWYCHRLSGRHNGDPERPAT
jgi:hypothetical protein